MKFVIIATAFAYTIGNIVWNKFGINEPKVMYVPLALFISAMLFYINREISGEKTPKYLNVLFKYFLILSYGNIVKQILYTDRIKQVNDYFWGGFVTVWLLFNLLKLKNGRPSK